jgi:hypothetical protein
MSLYRGVAARGEPMRGCSFARACRKRRAVLVLPQRLHAVARQDKFRHWLEAVPIP